jgi:hypothetical protein
MRAGGMAKSVTASVADEPPALGVRVPDAREQLPTAGPFGVVDVAAGPQIVGRPVRAAHVLVVWPGV